MTFTHRLRPIPIFAALAILAGAGALVAQIEPGDRGIAPVSSAANYEIGGVTVDVAGKTADEARTGGWRLAQRKGWKMLWARINKRPVSEAPGLSDSTLDSMVSGIIVEDEQIGPRRYVATLGVAFDRARTGQLLGVAGAGPRSAPMLVIPLMWSGGTPTSFELRNEWQRAWARFRTGNSRIDYVRAVGNGSDPLLLNVAQINRRGRLWWRVLLDQHGAADIVVPQVALERQWPGGPVIGRFTALHGPDAREIGSFTLRVQNAAALPAMMDEGVRRIDEIYVRALAAGELGLDSALIVEEPALLDEAAEDSLAEEVPGVTAAYTVQVETADAAALAFAENSIRSVPGVRRTATTSLALGGVSVLGVSFDGDLGALRSALAARGWLIEEAGGVLRLRRAAAAPAPGAAAKGA